MQNHVVSAFLFPAASVSRAMSSPTMTTTPAWGQNLDETTLTPFLFLELESVGNSNYHGAFIAVTKRFSAGLQFAVSYTFSKALNENDATGDTGSPVSDPSNIRRDYGLSSSDQRHRFVVEGVLTPRINPMRS